MENALYMYALYLLNQTCTDKSLGDGKELISLVTVISFSRSQEVIE